MEGFKTSRASAFFSGTLKYKCTLKDLAIRVCFLTVLTVILPILREKFCSLILH